jgi:hypothetical protein
MAVKQKVLAEKFWAFFLFKVFNNDLVIFLWLVIMPTAMQ